MPGVPPDRMMKVTKEELIADIIERYKNISLEILTLVE
jgi:hypothetical protein